MKTYELTATVRTTFGNGPARTLRRQGRVPAVLYGPGSDPVNLAVSLSDLEAVIKQAGHEQFLLDLRIENGGVVRRNAMIKELQLHPISLRCLHADFYEVAMDRMITVSVPVETIGKAEGEEKGGMLQVVRRELEVKCLPSDVPSSIEVDVSALDLGDSIHLLDIPVADNIELVATTNSTVVTVIAPKVEAEPEEEELEEGAEDEELAAESEDESPEA
ncbi:50S ribosomal protein L25/general stress protein Ctc [Thermodesulfobacteriota bacterium]